MRHIQWIFKIEEFNYFQSSMNVSIICFVNNLKNFKEIRLGLRFIDTIFERKKQINGSPNPFVDLLQSISWPNAAKSKPPKI